MQRKNIHTSHQKSDSHESCTVLAIGRMQDFEPKRSLGLNETL